MLRGITFLIALIGYLLAGTIGYFAFYPLSVTPQKKLDLAEIMSCTKMSNTYGYKDMTDESLLSLKNTIGAKLPIEQMRSFVMNLDKAAEYTGQRTVMNIDYCDVSGTEVENLNKVTTYLRTVSKYYEFGTFNEFVTSINNLPFASISNFEITVNSSFARTNVCNSSIVDSKLYLFLTLDSNRASSKRMVLFTIQLEDLDNTTLIQKATKNIIQTGHYLKAQINCNG